MIRHYIVHFVDAKLSYQSSKLSYQSPKLSYQSPKLSYQSPKLSITGLNTLNTISQTHWLTDPDFPKRVIAATKQKMIPDQWMYAPICPTRSDHVDFVFAIKKLELVEILHVEWTKRYPLKWIIWKLSYYSQKKVDDSSLASL